MKVCEYIDCNNEIPSSNRQGGAIGRRKKFCCKKCYNHHYHPRKNPGSLYGVNGQGDRSDPTPRLSFYNKDGIPTHELQEMTPSKIAKEFHNFMSTPELDKRRGAI